MKVEQAKDLIGRRILAALPTSYRSSPAVEELRMLELSPSGEWLKTMDQHGRRKWQQTAVVSCVEVLDQREPRPQVKPS